MRSWSHGWTRFPRSWRRSRRNGRGPRMRIYLACTVRGDRGGVEAARAVAARLKQHGHELLTTHLLDDHADQAEAALSEEQVFRRDLEWLSGCDVLVAEASGSTYG